MNEYYTTEDSEVCYDTIEDAIASASKFPVEILVMRRRQLDSKRIAQVVMDRLLEDLDEDFGDPNGEITEPTPAMREAAQAFSDKICRLYTPWQCEPTGEKFWVDENGKRV